MMVYKLVSGVDAETMLNETADSESAVIMADDLRKEAENFLSSIVTNHPPEVGVTPEDYNPPEGLLAVTKPGRENVYSAISGLEVENITNHLLDAESRSQIAAKIQKEAETFFASISDQSPERRPKRYLFENERLEGQVTIPGDSVIVTSTYFWPMLARLPRGILHTHNIGSTMLLL